MLATLAFLAVLITGQVSAYPRFYNEGKGGGPCSLPTTGNEYHKDPIQDGDITLTMMDGTVPTTVWTPGNTYAMVASYPSPLHIWVLTSDGTFATANEGIGCESKSVFHVDDASAPELAFTWTAPDTCTTVTFSANAALSKTDTFRQATLTVDCSTPNNATGGTNATIPRPPASLPPPSNRPPTAPTSAAGGALGKMLSTVALLALLAILL